MALLMRCWVGCERRPASRPGHVSGEEWELSDLLRRKLWGKGIASRAACLLLHTAAQHDEDQDEDQPVLVVTQRSNEASLSRPALGPLARGHLFGAEQWLGGRQLTPRVISRRMPAPAFANGRAGGGSVREGRAEPRAREVRPPRTSPLPASRCS